MSVKSEASLRGFSGLSAYRDAGSFTIYAGCSNDAVGEVIDLVVEELRQVKQEQVPVAELQRAKDHLKGSLMLSLENTASRMSHLARQEIYFDRQFGLDETLEGIERVTGGRAARRGDLFEWLAVGDRAGQRERLQIPRERLELRRRRKDTSTGCARVERQNLLPLCPWCLPCYST